LLKRSPLGTVVRWVAAIKASVHAKLLAGFFLVTLLVIGLGAMSLQTIAKMTSQAQLLDEAHERVHWSQEIQYASHAEGVDADVAERCSVCLMILRDNVERWFLLGKTPGPFARNCSAGRKATGSDPAPG
jgi:hypothetical protein